jgi:hypothetical protein
MNPEDIQVIIGILSKYYIWEILIMGIAIGLTMILKLPIKKKAVKLQEKYGVDKSMLTWITAFIPYVLCAIMVFVLFWYRSGFTEKLDSLEWTRIATEIGVLGSGAIGLYEAIKKIIKGSIAIHQKKIKAKEEAELPPASKYRVKKEK